MLARHYISLASPIDQHLSCLQGLCADSGRHRPRRQRQLPAELRRPGAADRSRGRADRHRPPLASGGGVGPSS